MHNQFTAHDIFTSTLNCVDCGADCSSTPWYQAHCKVQYHTDFALWFSSLRWNLPLHSVLYSAHWMFSFITHIRGFKMQIKKPFAGHRTWGERNFSSALREEALQQDEFLRDIDSRIHAINPSRLNKIKNRSSYSSLLGDVRETWQTNRKT